MVTNEQKLENWKALFVDKDGREIDNWQFYGFHLHIGDLEFFKKFNDMDRSSFEYRREKFRALWILSQFYDYQEECHCKILNEQALISFTTEELESDWWKEFD